MHIVEHYITVQHNEDCLYELKEYDSQEILLNKEVSFKSAYTVC